MDTVRNELQSLAKDGLLRAEDVVEFARDPSTALHSRFEWDDAKASHEFRLIQARRLIVSVRIMPANDKPSIQAFVSLKADRLEPGGGYRETIAVLSDDELRDQLLQQAWSDFKYFESKYHALEELAPIFKAAKKVRRRKAIPA